MKANKENKIKINELVQEVLKDSYYFQNLNQYGTHYFWIKNHNKFKAIFADNFDEFLIKVRQTAELYLNHLHKCKIENIISQIQKIKRREKRR